MKAVRQPAIRLLFEEEMFVDGFSGGGGLSEGFEMAFGRSPDIAINHDKEALAMHRRNHPSTRHIRSNIRKVRYGPLVRGHRVAGGWFSPDCTYFSKARGGKPYRPRNRARRIRGLAWEVYRFALEVKKATGHYPRALFMENVEEIKHWCPLDKDGNPDWSKRGKNFQKWVAQFRNLGAVVDWRELRAHRYGAPTLRKRLFVVIRFDGQPIVWPEAEYGPDKKPYRMAADGIDFSLPVPSIFLTKAQAKAWGKAHGVPSPHRPLAKPSLRRVARGTMRFVVNSQEPFLVSVRHQDDSHIHSTREPIRTIPGSDREFALVAPVLVNTRNGERLGQAPRVQDIRRPFNTITAEGSQGAMVAAFLAKHNGGHEATGQRLTAPADTIVCRENKALVTSHLLKMKGTCRDGQRVTDPIHTIQAHGNHYAEVRVEAHQVKDDQIPPSAYKVYAFLLKYYGTKKDGITLRGPLDTITTKDRFAVVTVTVDGETYVIVDIGMRMLTPRELFLCQGFPPDYIIDCQVRVKVRGKWMMKWLTKKAQTRLVGNSVPPHIAAALVRANLPDLELRYAA